MNYTSTEGGEGAKERRINLPCSPPTSQSLPSQVCHNSAFLEDAVPHCLVYQRCRAGTHDTLRNLKHSTTFKFVSRTSLANSKETKGKDPAVGPD